MCILGMIHKQFIFVPGTGESLVTRRGYRLHVAPLVSTVCSMCVQSDRETASNADQSNIQYYASYFFSKSLRANIDIKEKIKEAASSVKEKERKSPFTVEKSSYKRIYIETQGGKGQGGWLLLHARTRRDGETNREIPIYLFLTFTEFLKFRKDESEIIKTISRPSVCVHRSTLSMIEITFTLCYSSLPPSLPRPVLLPNNQRNLLFK